MNLREFAPYAAAILAVYLGWIIYRLIRLGRGKRLAVSLPPEEEIHSQILGGDSQPAFSSVSYDSRANIRTEQIRSGSGAGDEPVLGGSFEAQMELRQVKRSLDELRARCEQLEASLSGVREELHDLQAASQVSPVYNDAVAMARRGVVAEAIAERCGISVAEAQLVAALSSNSQGEASHDRD